MDLHVAISELEAERERLDTAITTLRSLNGNENGVRSERIQTGSTKPVRRTLSAAARLRISRAQRKRWRNARKLQNAA